MPHDFLRNQPMTVDSGYAKERFGPGVPILVLAGIPIALLVGIAVVAFKHGLLAYGILFAGAGLAPCLLLASLKIDFRSDGFTYRTIRGHRVVDYGDIECGFFKTISGWGQSVPVFHVRLRNGDSFKLNLRVLPMKARAMLVSALDAHGVSVVPDSPVAEIKIRRIRAGDWEALNRTVGLLFLGSWIAGGLGVYGLMALLKHVLTPHCTGVQFITIARVFQIVMAVGAGFFIAGGIVFTYVARVCRRGRLSKDAAVRAHYGKTSRRLVWVMGVVDVGLLVFLVLAADTYIGLAPEGILLNPYWSFHVQKVYPYKAVQGIYHWRREHGKYGPEDVQGWALRFSDGRRWTTKDGGYSERDFPDELFKTIESRSGIEITQVEFKEEIP